MTNEEASKILHVLWVYYHHYLTEKEAEAVDMAIEALKQPEQKKGVWMMNTGLGTMCSNCYYKLETTGLPSKCPCCGANMEGIKDGCFNQ